MTRLNRMLGVALFGGVLAGACSESGGSVAVEGESASAQGFELLRRGGGAESSSLALRASLHSLVSRLADLQADSLGDNARNGFIDSDPDDGGWDWLVAPTATSHSATLSPDNLYGSIALVPWAVLRSGSRSFRWHTAALDAALGIQNNPQVDSPPDFVYLVLLADSTDNAGFSQLAKARYDARLTAAGGARAFAERVRDQRHAQGNDGLIAYDLAWLTLGASALDTAFPDAGYGTDANAYAEVVVQDLTGSSPRFDVRDPTEAFYVQGLAWSLLALTRSGTAPELREQVSTQLLALQLASGAWGWNASYPGANLQASAQVIQALSLSLGRPSARRAERRAAHWLISQQAPNGGWLYTADQENPLLDAEIGLALFLAGTSAGTREGLTPDGAATVAQPLTVPATDDASPPLAQPLPL